MLLQRVAPYAKVAGVTIGIPRKGLSTSRSLSLVRLRSERPFTASSRNLSSAGDLVGGNLDDDRCQRDQVFLAEAGGAEALPSISLTVIRFSARTVFAVWHRANFLAQMSRRERERCETLLRARPHRPGMPVLDPVPHLFLTTGSPRGCPAPPSPSRRPAPRSKNRDRLPIRRPVIPTASPAGPRSRPPLPSNRAAPESSRRAASPPPARRFGRPLPAPCARTRR